MSRRLPSLNALRTFEAAARHESFTKAAADLSVTQSAVSHQVKALEVELGLKLFIRESKSLILTDPGRSYRLGRLLHCAHQLALRPMRMVESDKLLHAHVNPHHDDQNS